MRPSRLRNYAIRGKQTGAGWRMPRSVKKAAALPLGIQMPFAAKQAWATGLESFEIVVDGSGALESLAHTNEIAGQTRCTTEKPQIRKRELRKSILSHFWKK